MIKFFRSRLLLAANFAVLTSGLLLAPLPAAASHGIKCGWVLVSSIGNNNTYVFVCGVKGP
jgi:hypothetical protein